MIIHSNKFGNLIIYIFVKKKKTCIGIYYLHVKSSFQYKFNIMYSHKTIGVGSYI